MHNSVLEGLNKESYLPHYILFLPDRDIILQADFYHPGIGYILQQQLNWLLHNVHSLIQSRKDDLKQHFTGAVEKNSPKSIWVKMIKRPFIKDHAFPFYNMVVDLRIIFNKILDDLLPSLRNVILIDPCVKFDENSFDHFGNLTFTGKIQFWEFIDAEIRNIDNPSSFQHKKAPVNQHPEVSHHPQPDGQYPKNIYSHHKSRTNQAFFRRSRSHHHSQAHSRNRKDIWGEAGCRAKNGSFY